MLPINLTSDGDYMMLDGLRPDNEYRIVIPGAAKQIHIGEMIFTETYCTVCGEEELNKTSFTAYKENGMPKTPTDEWGSITITK